MTREDFEKHMRDVAGGPRTHEELAAAERTYQARLMEGRAELAQAEFEHRRPPGAASVSRMAALKASMPSFTHDLASLPEVPEVETVEEAPTNGARAANVRSDPPLDRDMLKALGRLFVEVKKRRGRAEAWDEVVDALMYNLDRLAPGWGTIKDIISLARSLDEYSNPVAPSNGKEPKDLTALYRKVLIKPE